MRDTDLELDGGRHTKGAQYGPVMDQVVRTLEDMEEAGDPVEFDPLDPSEAAAVLAVEKQERREALDAYLDTIEPQEPKQYLAAWELEAAKKAAAERLGPGARGMSERTRREMWSWVLSLPFEMLGDRPPWITLTYPGD